MRPLYIDPDIRQAETLPASFYRDETMFKDAREAIFTRWWQYASDVPGAASTDNVLPFTLLPGFLDEPLLLTKSNDDDWRALSNVCTHRGTILVQEPGRYRQIACPYHGRCFRLDGAFKSMPAFKEALGFPRPEDHLPTLPLEEWLGLFFVALDPAVPFADVIAPIREYVDFLPLDTLDYDPRQSRDFVVNSHWALYCDNYLEGLHIPFVHPALNEAIDFSAYEYHQFPYCNLQVGIADPGQPAFGLPEGHPDAGRAIYAYYFWVYPNLMFNFYPWGLSLNIVEPTGIDTCLVRFRTYTFKGTGFDRSVNAIDETELEDETVVEQVQLGVQSRLYRTGRFSPKMEPNVHHFHRLLASDINAYRDV